MLAHLKLLCRCLRSSLHADIVLLTNSHIISIYWFLFIHYTTRAAHKKCNHTRRIRNIHNKKGLEICTQRCHRHVHHCNCYTVSGWSRSKCHYFTLQKHVNLLLLCESSCTSRLSSQTWLVVCRQRWATRRQCCHEPWTTKLKKCSHTYPFCCFVYEFCGTILGFLYYQTRQWTYSSYLVLQNATTLSSV